MSLVSPLKCSQVTGVTTATLRDCWSISLCAHSDGGSKQSRHHCEHSDPETFKTTLPARQPRSPSESLWKSNNPARRRDAAWDWVEWASTDCTTLARHTHTLMQLVEKVVCCCLFLLNFAVRGGFQCTCSERSVLESFKAGNSNYTDKLCLTYSAVTICFLLSHNRSRRKETNTMYEVFAQNELIPFKCRTKTSYFKRHNVSIRTWQHYCLCSFLIYNLKYI